MRDDRQAGSPNGGSSPQPVDSTRERGSDSSARGEDARGEGRGYRGFRDLKAMWRATLLGRCPNCGEGHMFESLYSLHDTCPVCDVCFERDTGSWLGALVMTYVAAILSLLLLSVILVPRYGLYEGFGLTLAGAAIATVLLIYRPAKAWWVWWMWAAGFVYGDDERSEDRKG